MDHPFGWLARGIERAPPGDEPGDPRRSAAFHALLRIGCGSTGTCEKRPAGQEELVANEQGAERREPLGIEGLVLGPGHIGERRDQTVAQVEQGGPDLRRQVQGRGSGLRSRLDALRQLDLQGEGLAQTGGIQTGGVCAPRGPRWEDRERACTWRPRA